jgi:hypothetical protein
MFLFRQEDLSQAIRLALLWIPSLSENRSSAPCAAMHLLIRLGKNSRSADQRSLYSAELTTNGFASGALNEEQKIQADQFRITAPSG